MAGQAMPMGHARRTLLATAGSCSTFFDRRRPAEPFTREQVAFVAASPAVSASGDGWRVYTPPAMADDNAQHLRRVVMLGAELPVPDDELARRVVDQLRTLIGVHGDVDVSAWELAQLVGEDNAGAVEHTLRALLASGHLLLLGASPRPPGIAPCFVSCGECGMLIQAVHRRALEGALVVHLRDVHGVNAEVDLTPPTERDQYH